MVRRVLITVLTVLSIMTLVSCKDKDNHIQIEDNADKEMIEYEYDSSIYNEIILDYLDAQFGTREMVEEFLNKHENNITNSLKSQIIKTIQETDTSELVENFETNGDEGDEWDSGTTDTGDDISLDSEAYSADETEVNEEEEPRHTIKYIDMYPDMIVVLVDHTYSGNFKLIARLEDYKISNIEIYR